MTLATKSPLKTVNWKQVHIATYFPHIYYKLKAASRKYHLRGAGVVCCHLLHLAKHLSPRQLHVRLNGEAGTDGKPQDVLFPDLARRYVDPSCVVDLRVELLIDGVGAFQPEADEPHHSWHWQLKSSVSLDQFGKFLGQRHLGGKVTSCHESYHTTCSRI